MEYIILFILELGKLLNAMSPYLLLGFLFAGILKVMFPQSWIDKYMGKSNFKSVVRTALLGIPLPLCSCGVIPTGISFYKNGASKGSSVSFLISTPQTGVDSILVTYSMLGLPFAIIRIFAALITGVLGGVITNLSSKNESIHEEKSDCHCSTSSVPKHSLFKIFHYGFYEFLMDIAKWLVIGILIATVMAVIIPDNFFESYLKNEWLSMFIILLASVPLYLCATASVPIAAVLMLKGLSPGAALVLLMAGPATNAATITVIKNVFGNKTLLSYLGSIIFGALFFGALINNFVPREWFNITTTMHAGHEHELLPYWFKTLSSFVLVGLIVNGYVRNALKRLRAKRKKGDSSHAQPAFSAAALDFSKMQIIQPANESISLRVEGMTCSHCKNSVETNLIKLKSITEVIADPKGKTVDIKGNGLDLDEIQNTINGLGYTCKGKI